MDIITGERFTWATPPVLTSSDGLCSTAMLLTADCTGHSLTQYHQVPQTNKINPGFPGHPDVGLSVQAAQQRSQPLQLSLGDQVSLHCNSNTSRGILIESVRCFGPTSSILR